MMGHPGDDALMPLAKQANAAGIIMTYQNVDPAGVRAKFGGGYVGANLATQGKALARETIVFFEPKNHIHFLQWGREENYIHTWIYNSIALSPDSS